MPRPRVLFLGPGHSPLARARVAPFLDQVEALWVTTEPIPPDWLREHPTCASLLLPRPLLRRLPRRLFLHTADYLLEVGDLIRRRFRPDLIHVHYLSQLDALALLPHPRVPLVVTLMGADVQSDQVARPLLLDRAVRRILGRAAAVTAKSEFLAARARELGAQPERLHLVPWGVDLARFRALDRTAARAELGLPAAGTLLLSSRALQPLYNHLPLLEALSALPAPPGVVFTRHAEDPAHAERVASRARELGIATWFLPAQAPEAMPRLYAAADAVASLPASDGLPQTLLEALACDRPVLALDLEAYHELPFGPEALVRVRHAAGSPDPADLRRGLEALLALRGDLSRARDWIAAHAGFQESVERVRAIYARLTPSR